MIFALNDKGKIVAVDSVLNGIECNCTCFCHTPGKKVLAKNKGKDRQRHFAHEDGSNIQPDAYLHELSKKILSFTGSIFIPNITLPLWIEGGVGFTNFNCKDEEKIDYYNGVPEHIFAEFRPDLLMDCMDGRKLIVEIAVTHKVDDEKKQKIRREGIPAIEIDMSKFDLLKQEDLENFLRKNTSCKEWIYAGFDTNNYSGTIIKHWSGRKITVRQDGQYEVKCPLGKKVFFRHESPCGPCEYYIGEPTHIDSEDTIYCIGDYKANSLEEMILKMKATEKGECPRCGSKLDVRKSSHNKEKRYRKCKNPSCAFNETIREQTSKTLQLSFDDLQ
jgi:hypothetical protein